MNEFVLSLPADWLRRALVFFLVLCRFSGVALIGPVFGSDAVPAKIRIGVAAALAAVVSPLVPPANDALIESFRRLPGAAALVASELIVGLAIGFVFTIVLAGISFGGHILSQQIGFALAEVIDPVSISQTTILAQFKRTLGLMLFVALNLHLVVVALLVRSLAIVPPGTAALSPGTAAAMASPLGSMLFTIAVRVAGPGMLALLLVTVAMAFLARAVPEMNIFMIGFAVRIFVGLWVVFLSVPLLAELFAELFGDAAGAAGAILRGFAGGS